jgi:hypothetical protein
MNQGLGPSVMKEGNAAGCAGIDANINHLSVLSSSFRIASAMMHAE